MRIYSLLLVFLGFCISNTACMALKKGITKPPKAIIVISYDQMRGDYPESFSRFWGSKGFNRIANEGSTSPLCHFNHISNMTCPGHAVLLTGAYPSLTGIVSNDFFDAPSGCMCYCTEDKNSPVHGNSSIGRSPKLLNQTTLGDEVRSKFPKSKGLSIAIKDRAAILMAGKNTANRVIWFDWKSRKFTTSSYYKNTSWIEQLNNALPFTSFAGRTWNAIISDSLAKEDSIEVEGKFPGGDGIFPHDLGKPEQDHYTEALMSSPFGISYLFDAVKFAMKKESIGMDNQPDIVSIGVSTTDLTGHLFGPDSREIQELYVHADSILGAFIDHLDATIGRKNYVMVISSDHGVGPIPEYITKFGKVPVDAGRIQEKEILERLESEMNKRFVFQDHGRWIKQFEPPTLFINDTMVKKSGYEKSMIIDTLCAILSSINGMAHAVPTAMIQQGRIPPGWDKELLEMYRNDIHPDRTGEIMFMVKPYWVFGPKPATHGTPYDYDRYVPLMFFGGNVPAGQISGKTDPADIMPTLASMLNIRVQQRHGKDLELIRTKKQNNKK